MLMTVSGDTVFWRCGEQLYRLKKNRVASAEVTEHGRVGILRIGFCQVEE